MMGGGWKGVGLPGYPQANGGGSASHSLPPPGSGGALPSDPSHTHSTVVSREWWGHKDGGNPPPHGSQGTAPPHPTASYAPSPVTALWSPLQPGCAPPRLWGGCGYPQSGCPQPWDGATITCGSPAGRVGGGGGAEGRRTPMAAFRSLIVTCLARSTAWTTCCWCWGERGTWAGGDGEGLPPTRYAGFEALLGAQPPLPIAPPRCGDTHLLR